MEVFAAAHIVRAFSYEDFIFIYKNFEIFVVKHKPRITYIILNADSDAIARKELYGFIKGHFAAVGVLLDF